MENLIQFIENRNNCLKGSQYTLLELGRLIVSVSSVGYVNVEDSSRRINVITYKSFATDIVKLFDDIGISDWNVIDRMPDNGLVLSFNY